MSEFRIKSGDIVQRVDEPGVPCVVVPWAHPHNERFGVIRVTSRGRFSGDHYGSYCDRGQTYGSGRQLLEPYQELAPKEVWRGDLMDDDGRLFATLYRENESNLKKEIARYSSSTATITKYVRAEE